MNPSLTADDWAELRRLLEEVARLLDIRGGPTQLASDASHLLPLLAHRERALESRRSVAREVRGESATARKRRVTEAIHARDGGCTAKGVSPLPDSPSGCRGALEIDHQWGRGREEGTIENQRQLCRRHHEIKTASSPSRAFWIEHFRAHAKWHEYGEELAKCDKALAIEKAQHPERDTRGEQ